MEEKWRETLKEMSLEHEIFHKKWDEWEGKLKGKSNVFKICKDLLGFAKSFYKNHFDIEEKIIFPLYLKLRPREVKLIEELKKEHKNVIKKLKDLEGPEDIESNEMANVTLKHIDTMRSHAEKEKEMYDFLLKKYLEGC